MRLNTVFENRLLKILSMLVFLYFFLYIVCLFLYIFFVFNDIQYTGILDLPV